MNVTENIKKILVRPKNKVTETQLHIEIYNVLKEKIKRNVLMTTFPAGGGGRVRGAILKRMGLVSGWPDIQLLHNGVYHGIEVKLVNGKLSDNQRRIHKEIIKQGGYVEVARSKNDAINAIKDWKLYRR